MEMTARLTRGMLEELLAPWQELRLRLPSKAQRYPGLGIENSTWVITSNSTLMPPFLAEYSSPTVIRVVPRETSVAVSPAEPAVHAQVRSVLQYFGLSKSDLAKLLGITRPTLYAWLDGHIEPKSENTRRLVALASLVERSPGSQEQALFHAYLERPISGFPLALIEALAAPTLDTALIRAMVTKIRIMTTERNVRIGKDTSKPKQAGLSEATEERILEENLIAIGPED
jgi:DNA-binding transcriptional regulator YiaG